MANNQEILTKAIEKAIANGWQADKDTSWVEDYIKYMDSDEMYHLFYDASHDFAKALWGDSPQPVVFVEEGERSFNSVLLAEQKPVIRPKWMVMLTQMVIADDPIAYLGENI